MKEVKVLACFKFYAQVFSSWCILPGYSLAVSARSNYLLLNGVLKFFIECTQRIILCIWEVLFPPDLIVINFRLQKIGSKERRIQIEIVELGCSKFAVQRSCDSFAVAQPDICFWKDRIDQICGG